YQVDEKDGIEVTAGDLKLPMNEVVVTKDIIRQDLRLVDADGVECLPTEEIFAKLARMGYEKPPPKTAWNKFSSSIASAVIFLAIGFRVYQAQAKGKEIREEEEIKAFCFKEGRIEVIDADEDITLVNMETKVDVDVELHGRIERKDDENAVVKEMKAEKVRILDEHIAKRIHDEEVKQPAAREKQEQDDFKRAQELQQQDKEPTKKRVAEETLLQESFKKLRAKLEVSAAEEGEEVKVPNAPASPSPTNDPSPPPQDPTPTPYSTPPASPPQEQPTITSESTMSLLTTLMKTCDSLSQKVVELEQDKHTQALEILKLKKRVKKLKKKKRSKHSGLKRLRKGRIDQDVSAATKDVNVAEPTIFDDEEVKMTMAQTLIKLKAEKAKLLDEQMAQRLHDREVEKVAARDKQEKDDLERAQVIQKQYEDKEENIDWSAVVDQVQERRLDNIRKYQNLRKKPVSIAQARKNMIIYMKKMVRYKMKHFRDVEEPKKKRVAKEALLQESFKRLKEVEVSGSESTQETPSNDPKEMSAEDETYKNVSQEIRDQLNAEAKAVQIILNGIDNDIYSTVDTCLNACEMWKAIERAERIARVANLLALDAQQQPVYHPQNHPTHYTQNSSTRSQQAATRNRGKAIVNSLQPIYDEEPSMVAEDDETSKDKEIDKLMALISL
nr:hypothetical protein [Tanacetum cinerariifolium]